MCVLPVALPQEVPAPPLLRLDDAIAQAVEYNRQIQSSALEVRKLEDKLAVTRTSRLPVFNVFALGSQRLTTLNFTFPAGAFGQDTPIGPIPATDTTISYPPGLSALVLGQVAQPLSQLYRINLSLHGLDVERQIAIQQERLQKQSIIDEVKRSYYTILQLQSSLESIQESIKYYKEMDRVTDQYVLQQTALKSQSLEVKTRLAKAEYDALALRNPIQTQKEQLNSLLGRDLRTEFRVSPVPEATGFETDLDAARKLALAQRPEVAQARLKVQQAEYERRVKKSEYIPNLSLSLSYFTPVNYSSLVPTNIANVGLLLQWEPFDWGRKKHELAQKDWSIEQANLSVHEVEDRVFIDVGNQFRKLQESLQLIVVKRLAQETARENLRVMSNRYRQDVRLLEDMLQAQASLAQADSEYQQALLGYWTARADFEKALGMDQ